MLSFCDTYRPMVIHTYREGLKAADSADAIVASAAGNIAASASEVAISIYNKDHRANVSATKL